ncbi:glycosyltransferase [Leptospira sp. 2 VSF19]|uniref:Glycosyltransferase n=1 Tax=Leptospira soteropolitanensis TaxID=2950025 RepID=A0AAW5VHF8_9LEPT|nr:glycosyltransferase family 2 protein [Leptospira soteropolitanensis]MCW7493189.1 glycosyltransferase [Leptospira soteropolitanensis]MCW7500742.1 glycosyltransferase [Leptospira soteropolitanensis]MCW7523039.1 glycosyltransferase [Leptospira soteropolitanensis]MCW7526854.1 glycosyltransferase [Leptospira soteropolitanensis]MCW7530757.1 glycosyltransferase [Leptospira soteropolitanensis]
MSSTENINIISIVTPSFNQGEFIERTLKSVISQEGDFFIDYIVMDGKSNDNTVDILDYFKKKYDVGELVQEFKGRKFKKFQIDSNCKVNCLGVSYRFYSEKDKGQTNAINNGWKIAEGNIIAWLNSDDVYLPGALSKVVSLFLNKDVYALYAIGLHIDKSDNLIEFYPIETYSFSRLFEYCIICQPTVFLRRDILDIIGYLNESLGYCMDYEYWLRVAKSFEFTFLPKTIACTRIHENTKTSQNFNVHNEILAMQKNLIGKVSAHWLFFYAKYFLLKMGIFGNGILLKIAVRLYAYFLRLKYQ